MNDWIADSHAILQHFLSGLILAIVLYLARKVRTITKLPDRMERAEETIVEHEQRIYNLEQAGR